MMNRKNEWRQKKCPGKRNGVIRNGAAGGARHPGVCGGGEEVFLTNPGVLVTRVRTPFQPAIALRSCERLVVPYAHSLGLGGRHDRCPSAGRSPHRALHRCS